MQNRFGLLVADVMPIYMIYLDILITMLNSVNFSTVICSPTVEYLCSREKPLVKPMAPGLFSIIFIFQHFAISISVYFTLHLYHKNTKNIILSSLSDLTLVSDREGIDNPFIALVARFFVCLCRCVGLLRSLLLD